MLCGLAKRRRQKDNIENQEVSCLGKGDKSILSPFKRLRVHAPLKQQNKKVGFSSGYSSIEDIQSGKNCDVKDTKNRSRFIDSGMCDRTQQSTFNFSKTHGHSKAQDSGFCDMTKNQSNTFSRTLNNITDRSRNVTTISNRHRLDSVSQEALTNELSKESGFGTMDSLKAFDTVDEAVEDRSWDAIDSASMVGAQGISLNQAMLMEPSRIEDIEPSTMHTRQILPKQVARLRNALHTLRPCTGPYSVMSSQAPSFKSGYSNAGYTDEDRLTTISLTSSKQAKFGRGQLKLSIQFNHGMLTVNVMQAQHLKARNDPRSTFVQIHLIPDDRSCEPCQTEVVTDTRSPSFNEKFSFEVIPSEDSRKRLYVSTWGIGSNGISEIIGCMSFGLKHLLHSRKELNGWYYLLPEELGHRKHMQVADQIKIHRKAQIPPVSNQNRNINLSDTFTVVVKKNQHGYGFTVIGAEPVTVGKVDSGSSAQRSGLCPGDNIVRINGQNVLTSTSEQIAQIIRYADNMIVLDVFRPREGRCETLVDVHASDSHTPLKVHCPEMTRVTEPRSHSSTSPAGSSSTDKSMAGDERSFAKENELDLAFVGGTSAFDTILDSPRYHNSYEESKVDPLSRRSAAIQKLLDCEEQFYCIVQFGIQRYSWPLSENFLSGKEHNTLFQNMEKLSSTSTYLVNQLRDRVMEMERTQGEDFIGDIYKNKLLSILDTFRTYCLGLPSAERLLSSLQDCPEFVDFLNDSIMEADDPTIQDFLHRPIEHLRKVVFHLQFLLSCTPPEHPDATDIKVVLQAFENFNSQAECVHNKAMSVHSQDSEQSRGSRASSMNTVLSADSDLLTLQKRLVFPEDLQEFTLATPQRHLIYSGELVWADDSASVELVGLLFSDMLLLAQEDAYGNLNVVEHPFYIYDILSLDFNCTHPNEFNIVIDGKSRTPSIDEPCYITLRTPSVQQKYTWQNLLQQRYEKCNSGATYDL